MDDRQLRSNVSLTGPACHLRSPVVPSSGERDESTQHRTTPEGPATRTGPLLRRANAHRGDTDVIIGGTPASELSTAWSATTNVIDVGGLAPTPSTAVWQPMDTIDGIPVGIASPQAFVGGGGAQAGYAGLVPFTPGVGLQPAYVPPDDYGSRIAYAHYAPATMTTTPAAAPDAPTQPASAAPAAPAPAAPAAAAPAVEKPVKGTTKKAAAKTVKVRSGDSLSKIAAANDTTWQKLYELNKGVIGSNPNLIRPGQVLKLP